MKFNLFFTAAAGIAALGLTGCHTCPPPEESMECYPICIEDKQRNAEDVKAQWENFKATPFYECAPTRRYPKIDMIAKLLADVSRHVKYEIVIPYIELDSEGLICGYYEFERDVRAAMTARNCDQQQAMKLILEDWQRAPGGQEKCRKLVEAIPRLQRLRADGQIYAAVQNRIPQDALKLALLIVADPQFKREIELMKRDVQRLMRDSKRMDAAAIQRDVKPFERTLNLAVSAYFKLIGLAQAADFLKTYLNDQSSQREAIEKFITDFDRMSKEEAAQPGR